jgi:3-oxoacyl-[acyl-carrier-protein] synthase-3
VPQAKFTKTKISGITVTTGQVLKKVDDDAKLFGGTPEQFERIKKAIGLNERWVVAEGTTTADLCEDAAQDLLQSSSVHPHQIDAIICVTQTPDHFQPCNAAILHGRMGLPKSTAAFDINLGCSGWVVGLYVASLMIEAGGCQKVLLLAGDTMSKCVNPRDRAVAHLFGDAGSATLLESGSCRSWFSLHTNGKGSDFIKIPSGGFRSPSSPESKIERTDEDGSVRCADNLAMNGGEVFNFSIFEEPLAIKEILEFSGFSVEEIDYIVFHQANKYIIGNIARRLKLPLEKAPCSIVERFGNQSSASIPATICSEIAEFLRSKPTRLVFSGFGVGLSWASCVMESSEIPILKIKSFI